MKKLFKDNETAAKEMLEEELRKTESIAAAAASIRRKMYLQIGIMLVSVAVTACAGIAFVSTAWFASNDDVDANDTQITSAAPDISLFISDMDGVPDVNSAAYGHSSGTRSLEGDLYPISTPDCTNWYIPGSWNGDGQVTSFEQVSTSLVADTNGQYAYTDEAAGKDRVAYNKSVYTLYTNETDQADHMDVYLAPAGENPVTVQYMTTDAGIQRNLLSALRVGVTDGDGNLLFVYVPVAENTSVAGNSAGSTPGAYYTVSGTPATLTEVTGNSPYKMMINGVSSSYHGCCATIDSTTGDFIAGTDKLCSADAEGSQIYVYTWLEGTDAQAKVNISDSDTFPITVKLRFVGIPIKNTNPTT